MKKNYFSLFALLIFSVSLNAQCKYGPRLSLGMSSLGGGNSSLAVQTGIFINAELKDRMGIQAEILYAIKKGNTVETITNTATGSKDEYKTKYNFTYIDIPVYAFVPLSTHITFLFGPQIGIVNKATYITSGPGITDTKKNSVQGAKATMGIAAGIDFQTASPIRFGLRFSTNGGQSFAGKSSFVGATVAYTMDW